MNKKGGDRIISVYWFAILFIVAAGIVYMVGVFYGEPYDVREIEAGILIDKVADCLTDGNYIRSDIFEQSFGDNFLSKCNLNFETEDFKEWNNVGQYYVEFDLIYFNTTISRFSLQHGNSGLKTYCDLEGKNLPVCLKRSFYAIDGSSEQNQYQVNILSAVRKTEKNVQ